MTLLFAHWVQNKRKAGNRGERRLTAKAFFRESRRLLVFAARAVPLDPWQRRTVLPPPAPEVPVRLRSLLLHLQDIVLNILHDPPRPPACVEIESGVELEMTV
jgi:hypothetical protein